MNVLYCDVCKKPLNCNVNHKEKSGRLKRPHPEGGARIDYDWSIRILIDRSRDSDLCQKCFDSLVIEYAESLKR